jgi:protein-disulfide isomerase
LFQRFYSVLIFIILLELVGCTSSCGGVAASSKPVRKPNVAFTSFPAITVDNLGPEQLAAFTKLVNEEICPCSCPTTFAGCLQANTKCKAAQVLGQWVADKIAEGVPAAYLQEPLAKEIGMGFSNGPQMINLDGTYSKGSKNPTVMVVEFADFDCTHCRTTAPILDAFVKKHEDAVQLVYKYFPLPKGTTIGKVAAEATEAAGRQGKFWEMHDALFRLDTLTEPKIIDEAKKLAGLKMDQFLADRKDPLLQQKVQASGQEAMQLGLMGTPTIFFNGRPYFLSMDMSGFEMRMEMERVRNESRCN